MTEGAHFLAVKPLSVKTTRASCADAVILNVMRHNARELQAEIGVGAESGIDASRIHLNVTLHGPATADGVASAARDAMREHGIVAPRKNATLGIEIVASLPAGLLIDHLAYFRDTAAWAQQHYRVPLLSAIVHNDESSPHLHLVLLPVRDGKLVGSELLGNRATMKAMQKDFHEQVAKQYGLRMPAAKKRHSAAQRAAGIALLRDALQANSGLTERAIDALLVPHAKNPEPLLMALGLAMPAPVVKGSFVATMTRKVRPESPDRIYKKSPIGHLRAQTADGFLPENEMSYALLGDCISAPNFPSSANPSSASNSAPGQANLLHHQASVNAQPDVACPAPGTAQPSATGQQASSSPAAPQPTTDQQRERSTTSIEQCGTDTGNPASPATAARGQNRTAPLAISQPAAIEQLAVQLSLNSDEAGQHLSCDAGPATATATARTKRATAKRQAKTVGTSTERTVAKDRVDTPATAQRQAASIEQGTVSQAGQVATAKTRKRISKIAASTGPSPRTSATGIAPAADQVGHQQDQQHSAHAIEEQAAPGGRPQTGDAGIEAAVDTPAKRSTVKGIVPADDTRAAQPSGGAAVPTRPHAPSIEHVTPRNAKASQVASARRAKTSTATPASAPAAPRAGKRSSTASRPAATPSTPSTSARSTSSTAAPSTSTQKPKRTATLKQASSTPALGKGQYDAYADQPDEIRRLADDEQGTARCERSTRPAVSSSAEPGKSWFDIGANQPDEIRTLGLAAYSSMSSARTAPAMRDALKLEPISPASASAVRSPEYSGQLQVDQQSSQRASESDRHGAAALDQLLMPAPRIIDSATAPQPAPAGIAARVPHRSPVSTIEQVPPQGGASTDTDLSPRQGEQLIITAKPAAPGSEQHQQTAHAQRAAGIKGRLQGRAFDGTDLTQHHQHGLAPLSNADDYERVSDDAQAAELWDGDLGEFVKAPAEATRRDARTPAGPTLATWSTYGMRLDLRH